MWKRRWWRTAMTWLERGRGYRGLSAAGSWARVVNKSAEWAQRWTNGHIQRLEAEKQMHRHL